MISRAKICGLATFVGPGVDLTDLREVNYFFGSNGTGKSTIARVLADPKSFPESACDDSGPHETLLFNEQFVANTIRLSPSMPSVFTIGSDSGDAAEQIVALETAIQESTQRRAGYTTTRAQKLSEIESARRTFYEQVWDSKKQLGKSLEPAFTGWNNSKKAFGDRMLEVAGDGPDDSIRLEGLVADAPLVFGDEPAEMPPVPTFEFTDDPEGKWALALREPIVTSSSGQLADLISRLGNADWVRAGMPMLETSHGLCPFCQQGVPLDRSEELHALFDATYEAAMTELVQQRADYEAAVDAAVASAEALASTEHPAIDIAIVRPLVELFKSAAASNRLMFSEKLQAPSTSIDYSPLAEHAQAVEDARSVAVDIVEQNNALVRNFASRRSRLVAHAWTFLASTGARPAVDAFNKVRRDAEKAIESLDKRSEVETRAIGEAKTRVKELRANITSSLPTAEALNSTLTAFGFDTFTVRPSEDESGYFIERNDGRSATASLSEGERNFLAFLYFYHLASGTLDRDSSPSPRVLVIDDPVSSLDSQVLFVVSSLIRQLVARATDPDDHGLAQVFVLTHNAYFHREVTFSQSRGDGCMKAESFWVVRRVASESSVERRWSNPVSTGYELLWEEVRSGSGSTVGIANAMRRILEYYFQILGGDKLQDLDQRFEGTDKLVCRALLSWSNQGSHVPSDDLFVAAEAYEAERYRVVFEQIFTKTSHEAHYKMMMKVAPEVVA